jgi:hypothetical protein
MVSAEYNARRMSFRIMLDRQSPWLLEFASALGGFGDAIAYSAVTHSWGLLRRRISEERIKSPPIRLVHYPVQRGYFSPPLRTILRSHHRIARLIRRDTLDARSVPLICCYPQYAPVAKLWPGPVVYYVTDLFRDADSGAYRRSRTAPISRV